MVKVLSLIIALFSITTLASININNESSEYSSSGNSFQLSNIKYEKEESFVYTATVNFISGQAAGIAFGSEENEKYFVFNVDRYENRVKLLYFEKDNNASEYIVNEIENDYYIGTKEKELSQSELNLVLPRLKEIPSVQLKVIVSSENDGVHAEFFADNIKRFGIDKDIVLDDTYQGGYLGFNTFNSKVKFSNVEIGKSDYSYYSEPYRNQYHFSQYAHWNNDPNGLVYYKGYYHLYYQTHPYSKYWSDMYWGHARSKDLAHWELLPICLFPDDESSGFGPGNGYMWSGSAMVYRKGMSSLIDSYDWFPNGNGEGLIAYYTRDGGLQDQVLMSSDDEGLTWTKRVRIPQTVIGIDYKVSCRDPKVFLVKEHLYGMTLSGMETNDVWILESNDLVNWKLSNHFNIKRPECVDIISIQADDGTSHNLFTFEGREYIVGSIAYENNKIVFKDSKDRDLSTLSIDELETQKMDFGPDSYATQSFYIDDVTCDNYGKSISMSWFSGVPNAEESIDSGALASVRDPWNGGGMTIPVEYKLYKNGDLYSLKEIPITKDSDVFAKQTIIDLENISVDSNNDILKDINTHQLELEVKLTNVLDNDVAIRINQNDDEYVEIGYSKEDGYYVDRSNTSSASLNLNNYSRKYITGALNKTDLSFYILSDNGGIEVFVDDFKYSFYVLTFSSPYALNASLLTNKQIQIKSLKANEILSTWKKSNIEGESSIYLSKSDVDLDLTLKKEEDILVYLSDLTLSPEYEIDNNVVSIMPNKYGIHIEAIKSGFGIISVKLNNKVKQINITVHEGVTSSDLNLKDGKSIQGDWYMSNLGFTGVETNGDGYYLTNDYYKDVTFSANINIDNDVNSGAAALILRASKDLSSALYVNYDNQDKIVKFWSNQRMISRSVNDINCHNFTLEVRLKLDNVKVFINNNKVIDEILLDSEPQEGYLGLNVFKTRAYFQNINIENDSYVYDGNDVNMKFVSSSPIKALYNVTNKNTLISKDYYEVNGRNLILHKEYFQTLKKIGNYVLRIVKDDISYEITIEVKSLPKVQFNDYVINEGSDLVVYLGNYQLGQIALNGTNLENNDYQIENNYLIISSNLLNIGDNEVTIDDNALNVKVLPLEHSEIIDTKGTNNIILYSIIGMSVVLVILFGLLIFKRRKKSCQQQLKM